MTEDRRPGDTIDDRIGDEDDEREDPVDRLAEEFAGRVRRGESPSIAEYEARHPEHADRLRRLLPTVAIMEQLKRDASSAPTYGTSRPLPARLGEFRVLRELGRGGMGVVYEAIQESLGRHVALKVIHHVHLDARRLERFRREAQAIAQLHHTNIVPIFGVGEHDGLPYFAMQYIAGRGLDALIAEWRATKSGPDQDPSRFAAGLGRQVAEGLQYAHEQGVLHRDIKPANLLIDEHGVACITDFGLAKLAGQEDLTESGDVIGTLRYLAPEALRGETGPRADVYSLGLTLYELLTLRSPFGDASASALLRQVSEGQIPRPRQVRPEIPRDLETIVLKAIAHEPDHRYATAGALADDLRRFLEDRPILAHRATPIKRAWRWARRNRMAASLLVTAAASLLLAAIAGWVGYASTRKALEGESLRRLEAERATRRADRTVSLSLEVFGELFDKLSPRRDPFPPPTGRAQPRRLPGGDRGPGPPPDGGPGRRPPPLRGGPGDNPFEAGDGPRGDRGQGPRGGPQADTALLRNVLSFYDRFARENETNPKLQSEAARAYFKVGDLYERLGRSSDAEKALARASAILEELIARYPGEPEYRFRIVEQIIMANPWSVAPSDLDRLEARLLKARTLIDGLSTGAPEDLAYIQDALHVHAKLGVVLQRQGRSAEAEASYRLAIALAGQILDRSPRDDRARMDRMDVREELAMLRLERGARDEAASLLKGALDDLVLVSSSFASDLAIADRCAILADDFRALGQEATADEMARRAEEIRAQPRPSGRGPRQP